MGIERELPWVKTIPRTANFRVRGCNLDGVTGMLRGPSRAGIDPSDQLYETYTFVTHLDWNETMYKGKSILNHGGGFPTASQKFVRIPRDEPLGQQTYT